MPHEHKVNIHERPTPSLAALFALLYLLAGMPVQAAQPTIATSSGPVRGTVEQGIIAFRGIPYAAPPVGALRFRAPEAVAPWSDPLEAAAFSPVCSQMRVEAGQPHVLGSEDCLYLNVYVPENASSHDAPVLVWIHGGGRRNGDGRRVVSDFVRETGTVVVMIQYRLDYLAFLAHPALSAETPDRLSSGNYGYQDAIAALQWVRREITSFGGDANRVTIGGMSGGGTMVCGLLASPRAAGLFQRAIIQSSGSCWFDTDTLASAEERGRRWAAAVGCGDDKAVTTCLRETAPVRFFTLGPSLDNPFPPGQMSYFTAMPMLGGRTGHLVDGQVIPRSFPAAFQQGVFHRVPIMIGIAGHEGRRVYGDLLYQIGAGDMQESDYVDALTGMTGSPAIAAMAAAAFPLQGTDAKPIERFADVATAAHYTCPHAELAQAVSQHTPVWLYENHVRGTRVNPQLDMGAYHGFDTELLFGGSFDGSVPVFNAEQQAAAGLFRAYVANFLRAGDPNGRGLAAWSPYASGDGEQHLVFSTRPHMQSGLRQQSCRFWREQRWDYLPEPQ